jgi:hypothetical protein
MMQLYASKAEAPKQQQPILFPGAETIGGRGLPLPRIVLGGFVAMRAEAPKPCISSPVADYAAECNLKPSGMTPSFA